jgi:hypothetical protein
MKLNIAIITTLSSAFIHDVVSQPMNGRGLQGMMERVQHRSVKRCLMDAGNGECAEDYWENAQLEADSEIEEEGGEDPMLAKMPGLDFKAYRRAEISSFYQEAPGSRTEKKPKFNGQAGKFVNMSPERLDLYW